jgi:hypothetical protein
LRLDRLGAARDSGASKHRFSDEQGYDEGSVEWVELPPEFRPQQGLFVAQVVGESMNRRIPKVRGAYLGKSEEARDRAKSLWRNIARLAT